jgi:hypothetical protein
MWKVRTKLVLVTVGAVEHLNRDSLAPRPPFGHTSTEDHTNEHYTHHP